MVALLVAMSADAQNAPRVAFEVATVRPSQPGSRLSERVLPTRVELANVPLRTLILRAFRKEVFELSAPDWLLNARFDIHATYASGMTAAQFPEMLQDLLVNRFGLVTHIEPRRIDAYELMVGKDGLKMEEVAVLDEVGKDFTTASGQKPSSDILFDTPDGPVRSMVIPGEIGSRTVTNRSLYESRTTPRRTTLIDAVRITMPEFASILRLNLDRPVVDKTRLTGVYRFKVELDVSQMATRMVPRDVNGNPTNEPTGVSTFKAVEGLGLRLEERRMPFGVLVVDKIERTPTEN